MPATPLVTNNNSNGNSEGHYSHKFSSRQSDDGDHDKDLTSFLPSLPLEVQYLIIRYAGLDRPADWDNFEDHARLLLPLLHVCRTWLPAVQSELVRELTITTTEQAQSFIQHVNNHKLLRQVKILRIGGKEAQPWPSLTKADEMAANLILRQCDSAHQVWVRNMHLLDFDNLIVSRNLHSLLVFCCSFVSDLATPPSSAPVSRAVSRAASRSNSRASTPLPFNLPAPVYLPHLEHLYLVNCRLPGSRLAAFTNKSLPNLSALGFGSNWLEDPYHPHSDEYLTDITLQALDPSLFPSLRCLSAGDELGQILDLMPRLALLDCWESSLTDRVTKTMPKTIRRLRLCESTVRLRVLGLLDDDDELNDWETMSPLIRELNALVLLHEMHLPADWENVDRYEELVNLARGKGVSVQWETTVEKSGFDLHFWELVEEVEQEDARRRGVSYSRPASISPPSLSPSSG